MIETLFQVLSFLAAAASAWLWSLASRKPKALPTDVAWNGEGPFTDQLNRQARLNSYAATGASLAALFQAIAIASRVFGVSNHVP